MLEFLKLINVTQASMASSSVAQSMSRHVPFDTDSAIFVMDNSATVHTCNDKDLFQNMTIYAENEGPSVATV